MKLAAGTMLLFLLIAPAMADEREHERSSFVAILSEPQRFDRASVSTIGFAVIENETSALYLGQADAESGVVTNGIWLDLSAARLDEKQKAALNRGYVYVEGVFYKGKSGDSGLKANGTLRELRRVSAWPFPGEER